MLCGAFIKNSYCSKPSLDFVSILRDVRYWLSVVDSTTLASACDLKV